MGNVITFKPLVLNLSILFSISAVLGRAFAFLFLMTGEEKSFFYNKFAFAKDTK
jgi:hypothetical protein